MKRSIATRWILILTALFVTQAFAGVVFSVNVAPPAIPIYAQPLCPGDGYIWTPGYYQYGDYGYYWVPGTWVLAPRPGFLWTPGYWGWGGGLYAWHAGYWGPHVGFYGGINYGHGYFGSGFSGGRWVGGAFHYNTAVSNVNIRNVHNTYIDRSAVHNNAGAAGHSFHGPGGSTAQASHHETSASRSPHRMGPTPAQVSHAQTAHAGHVASHGGGGGHGHR
jgi:hypothetical protein